MKFAPFLPCRGSLAAGLLAVSVVHADTPPKDTIVVTATRNEIPLEDAIVPVRVITRDEIELSLASDLAELLRFEAGIDIGRNGGPGQSTSLFLRGTESNHTLILIDGVRMNPGTIGGGAVQHISPAVIERVEIVKGTRSALFGTDAIGGVINIITRRAADTFAEAGAGAGSFGTRSGYLSAGRRDDDLEFGATIDLQATDGFPPRIGSELDRGYDNLSASAYATRRFDGGAVSFRHWQAEGSVEYLDFFLQPVSQDYRNATSAVELENRILRNGTSTLLVSWMEDDIRQNESPDFVESTRVAADWQYTHAFERHVLSGGLLGIEENAGSLSFGSGFDEDTWIRAVFLQDQWNGDGQRAFAAIRLTDHETFGNETTWNLEYAVDVGEFTLSAGAGRAFRAPDATDRYGFGGNPDLEPELADDYKAGARYAPGNRHRVELELYRYDIEDLIEFDLATFVLVNVDRAEIRGASLAWEYSGDTYTLRAEALRQSAENATTGTRLLRRAEETLSLNYTQELGAHRLGLSVLAAGDRVDFGGVELGGYVLANLTGQFAIGGAWQLNARIENLLDEDYSTAADFRMQDRSAFVELRYRWD